MRLWSLHPQYVDSRGLVALWREALLAQAVLANKTRAYHRHPQLLRFKKCKRPRVQIANYLQVIYQEARRRGYRFTKSKLGRVGRIEKICITRGQLDYEWVHLKRKLKARAPNWLKRFEEVRRPESHPIFRIIAGPIAEWEILPIRRETRGH